MPANIIRIGKDGNGLFYISGDGDIDPETMAKFALCGYMKQREKSIKRKKDEDLKNEYKKRHPFLSIFK